MAHVVLTCWGSHGDIDPFIGLALELRMRGHRATLATIAYYQPLIESLGLGFRPIRPGGDPSDIALIERIMHPTRGSQYLLQEVLFPVIEAMYEDIDAAAEGADLLVSHPVTFATPIVAARRRLPWANVVLAPTSMFSAYDFPAVPPAPWVKELQRFGTWPGRLIVGVARRETAKWAEPVFRFRERLGLERGANPIFEGQHSPHRVLALYSRVLGDPQPDWPANVVVTGHVFHDAPHGTALPPALEQFLADGPAPVVFTLGSSVVMIAKEFWRQSLDAARRLGVRAVLLAGPRAAELQDQIAAGAAGGSGPFLAVERAPHSLLFPHAAAVVQQCGIGTLAQSLRSGRPMLAVPYSHDQPDNAWRAKHLGMARTVHASRYSAPRAARALRTLLDEPAYTDAAGRVASIVRSEDGVRTACDAIERTFGLTVS
ncbi:MAG: glycosyltransferase [Vicinamibacterales bacterium]